jgi:transketolase
MTVLIARTVKGKGVSFLEDQEGWHGKALNQQEFELAIRELGDVDLEAHGRITPPPSLKAAVWSPSPVDLGPLTDRPLSTRAAYGRALVELAPSHPDMVVLDAEVSNSTFAATYATAYPERFFEMYIAEQNMVSAALGLSARGKTPYVSTFAAFFTRAFDQLRMAQYSRARANIKCTGSHAGVAIGPDGPSQMGLEDIALFRSLPDCVVLYPSDDVATGALVHVMADHHGMTYLRTTRQELPRLYTEGEQFPIGGSKTLRRSDSDRATVVAAGITLHEALKAADLLALEGIHIRVIDLYSIQPLDVPALHKAAAETAVVMTVEDHYAAGGIGEAVAAALSDVATPVVMLAVRTMPMSGTPAELLAFEGIDAAAIAARVRSVTGDTP